MLLKKAYIDNLVQAIGDNFSNSLALKHIITQLPSASYSQMIVFTQFLKEHLSSSNENKANFI